ncbi:MAG TPA: glycosyltransferase family 39 protein [Planctomycetota bacterium]|nr:glycosyltransferase family 39 protein [Planctomycetota bacterium]
MLPASDFGRPQRPGPGDLPSGRVPAWVLWLLAFLPLRIALAAVVPLLPEEAYHWNFARHPDLGYYDHPPMIAWAIAAGRLVLGDTPLGVRVVPLLFSLGTSVVLARLARRFYGDTAATWTVILFTLAPVPLLVSESGFPDSPLLFFWTLTMSLVWDAISGADPRRWIAAGAALGAAMLSKYTAILLVPSVFGYLLLSRSHRRQLLTPWPYLAGIVALVVFSPVVYWNWKHEWASFLFQSQGRMKESRGGFSLGAYLRAQALAPFALTAPLAGVALWRLFRSTRPEEIFLRACFVPMFLLFAVVSCLRPPHLLWPLASYMGVFVAMAGMIGEGDGKIARFYAGKRSALVAVSGVILLGGAAHLAWFLPYFSPLQGPYGWKEVAEAARSTRTQLPESAFFLGLGRKYTCTSQLAYQLRLPYDVHGANLIGEKALQYAYWSDPRQLQGRDAVVVVEGEIRAKENLDELQRGFDTVQPAGEILVPVGRSTLYPSPPLKFQLYIGRGYRPPPPPVPGK